MTNSIDEVSQTLGRLEAKMDAVIESGRETRDKMTVSQSHIEAAHKRLDAVEISAKASQDGVNDWYAVKRRVILAIIGLLGTGYVGGAALSNGVAAAPDGAAQNGGLLKLLSALLGAG